MKACLVPRLLWNNNYSRYCTISNCDERQMWAVISYVSASHFDSLGGYEIGKMHDMQGWYKWWG